MVTKLLVLNGPNLNLLGTRQPEIYGANTLDDVLANMTAHVADRDVELTLVQSNIEGELVSALHEARTWAAGVVFNAGAYTHTSVALRDAIVACELAVVETHITNVHAREEFRHTSLLAAVCVGVVAGFGVDSYLLALDGLLRHLDG